ncbi:hypothetical protein PHMEG_0004069 [Phytophthora megakarya]|uniref:Uncharacterized protein n=1 Tax=Phytophthora megakarya TaxID=4795 RepID=A0A225WUN0_9STRA|nr:hypothetical protein PHMEG_0004069 [Phytophthora megakarya]
MARDQRDGHGCGTGNPTTGVNTRSDGRGNEDRNNSGNDRPGVPQVSVVGHGGGIVDLGRAPPPQPPNKSTATTGDMSQAMPPQTVVREKAKALKVSKFYRLDNSFPVTMELKTRRAEVYRQAVATEVEWTEAQLISAAVVRDCDGHSSTTRRKHLDLGCNAEGYVHHEAHEATRGHGLLVTAGAGRIYWKLGECGDGVRRHVGRCLKTSEVGHGGTTGGYRQFRCELVV